MEHSTTYILLGLGTSGKAVAAWCLQKGLSAIIIDDAKDIEKESFSFPVMSSEEFLRYIPKSFLASEGMLCVTSPGFPYVNKAFKRIQELHIPIISEVELALRVAKNIPPLIGVTGTNGKTTVVELITHIINCSQKTAQAVGNIGTPLIEALTSEKPFPDWFVVELSSFQLALTSSPRFSIGCWLNISPNHLDWHSSMEEYVQAKERLYSLTCQDGFFFAHEGVSLTVREGCGPKMIRYGRGEQNPLRCVGEHILFCGETALLPEKLREAPQHDVDNFLIAYGVACTLGISSKNIVESFATFEKAPHRIELVEKVHAITYIDDSKSTNVASTEAAILSCNPPIVLIAGGVHKGASYAPWKKFAGRVSSIVAIGAAKNIIAQEVGEAIPVFFADSLPQAVQIASTAIQSGTVLFSPGCSSFDMFRDYKDRGRQFKEIVRSLDGLSTRDFIPKVIQ